MESNASSLTRIIPESFDKSVSMICHLLWTAGLTIVEEFDMSKEPYFRLGVAKRSCTVLLVDTPLLLFQAIALDRSAAVFVPLHIVISGDSDTSYIHWVDPVANSGLRPPASAKDALEEVYKRVTQALMRIS
jgi:hypothetical protein